MKEKVSKNSHKTFFYNSFILEINYQYKNPALKVFKEEDVEKHDTYDSNLYDHIEMFFNDNNDHLSSTDNSTIIYSSIFFHRMIRLEINI